MELRDAAAGEGVSHNREPHGPTRSDQQLLRQIRQSVALFTTTTTNSKWPNDYFFNSSQGSQIASVIDKDSINLLSLESQIQIDLKDAVSGQFCSECLCPGMVVDCSCLRPRQSVAATTRQAGIWAAAPRTASSKSTTSSRRRWRRKPGASSPAPPSTASATARMIDSLRWAIRMVQSTCSTRWLMRPVGRGCRRIRAVSRHCRVSHAFSIRLSMCRVWRPPMMTARWFCGTAARSSPNARSNRTMPHAPPLCSVLSILFSWSVVAWTACSPCMTPRLKSIRFICITT